MTGYPSDSLASCYLTGVFNQSSPLFMSI